MPIIDAMNYFREEIMGLARVVSSDLFVPSSLVVPVWLGHGILDEVVPLEFGRHAASTLRSLGLDVTIVEYGDLAHWYSSAQLEDIAVSLRDQVGIPEARW
jgi:predicted esterase